MKKNEIKKNEIKRECFSSDLSLRVPIGHVERLILSKTQKNILWTAFSLKKSNVIMLFKSELFTN